jgi:two-component system response regulator GlrR
LQREPKPLTADAMRVCLTHSWKGNVRELRSAIEKALLLSSGPEIGAADLFGSAAGAAGESGNGGVAGPDLMGSDPAKPSFREAKERFLAAFERDFLLRALRRSGGNITRAAEEVGMYRQNFQQKMRELGIRADDVVEGDEPPE